jgi:GTP-binding protein YchF
VHVAGGVDPLFDKEVIDTELQLKDLESVEKKIQRIEKMAKSGDAKARRELDTLLQFKDALTAGLNARAVEVDKEDLEAVRDLHLLTIKPVLYVANVDESSIHTGNAFVDRLRDKVKEEHAEVIILCAAIESQIAEFDEPEEKAMFLSEYGLEESGLNKLIYGAYALLNLITYFTAGVQEVRAWTIRKGWKAPQAAGVIHTDFERGFIKAEVIRIADYKQFKTEAGCRENGKISIEGKEYVVQDGDIMHFRFNV